MSVRAIEAEVSINSGVQAECTIGREVIVEVHDDVNLESLTATANGQYEPSEGVDGYDSVTVVVPPTIPDIEPLTVTANGTYTAEGDGFNPVTVNVPGFKATGSFVASTTGTGCTLDTGRDDWTYLLITPRVYPYEEPVARGIGVKFVNKSTNSLISAYGSGNSKSVAVEAGSSRQINVDTEITINGSAVTFAGTQANAGRFVAGCTYDWFAW